MAIENLLNKDTLWNKIKKYIYLIVFLFIFLILLMICCIVLSCCILGKMYQTTS